MKKQIEKKVEKKYVMPSLDWVSWKPADMKRVLAREYKVMMKNITAIKKIPNDQRTFENTIAALEYAQYGFADAMFQMGFLMQVSVDKRVRDVAQQLTDLYTPKLNEITYDIDLYHAVMACPRDKTYPPHEQLLFDDFIVGYKREGLHLSLAKRTQLKKITNEIAKLGNTFDANIRNSLGCITVSPQQVSGLPETFLGRLKKDKTGNYIVTTDYPEFGPFMQYSANREKRRELYIISKQKGGKQNLNILNTMRTLRHKKALLLGYGNHVDYQAEEMLAKTSVRIDNFLNSIVKKITRYVDTDLTPLRAEFSIDHGASDMQPWDVSYYAERVQKKFFALDYEKIREYFPLPYVMEVMLQRFSALLGIQFQSVDAGNLWHPDVVRYDVFDTKQQRALGVLTFDLFPRKGKFSHAAMFDIIAGHQIPGTDEYVLPLVGIVGNMTPAASGKPALLSLNEVRTLYHEMGHALHCILGAQDFRSQSGTNVSRDFVELPSQLAEYWFADEKLFLTSSRHYQTGKQLPRDTFTMIKNQRGFLEGYSTLNQLMFSIFDLRIHDGNKGDARGIFNDLFFKLNRMYMPRESYFPAGFGHLVGYDGQYWSYLWSEMLVAEAREIFKKTGMMNKKLGMKYRKEILEPGGSVREEDMVQKFFAHIPTPRALLQKIENDIRETQKFMKGKNKNKV